MSDPRRGSIPAPTEGQPRKARRVGNRSRPAEGPASSSRLRPPARCLSSRTPDACPSSHCPWTELNAALQEPRLATYLPEESLSFLCSILGVEGSNLQLAEHHKEGVKKHPRSLVRPVASHQQSACITSVSFFKTASRK